MSVVLCVVCPKENASSLLSLMPRNYCRCSSSNKLSSKLSFSSGVSAYSSAVANPSRSAEERVYEVVLKQADLMREHRRKTSMDLEKPIENDGNTNWNCLNEAFERCREVTTEYAKTFYLGTCSSAHLCV